MLLALTLPPWGWWPLGPVGAAVLFGAVREASWRARMWAGLCAGIGLYGPGLMWVTEFTGPGYVVLLLLEAAILAVALAALPAGRTSCAGFPAALVLAEALRGAWPFGGLPLGGIDLGQVGGPLAPAARIGGHLLLVALVGAGGVGLAGLWKWAGPGGRRSGVGPEPGRRTGGRAAVGAAAVLAGVMAVVACGVVAPSGSEAGTVRVAAVQGGGVRGLRAVDSNPAGVFEAHLAASRSIAAPVDLVLWPEDVVDIDGPLSGSPEESAMAGEARRLGATLVAGVVEDVDGDHFRNAAVAWGPDGARAGRYDKVHRVPFGEYIPARDLMDSLADLSAVPRDAIAGTGSGLLDTPAGRFGVTISYEVFFAARARAAVRAGGRVLLVPTNASSYRRSQVPGQEVAVARLRAIETGRWVVQAAPTGYSAVIDHAGRVLSRSSLGRRQVLSRTVQVRTGSTLATRLGDGPAVAAALLVVAAGWALTGAAVRRSGVQESGSGRSPHDGAPATGVPSA